MGFSALLYHSACDGRYPDTGRAKYTVGLSDLREHLAALRGRGYQICSVRDTLEAYDAGQVTLHHTVVLTFDDGHRSCLDFADILNELGLHATFFVTSGFCRERSDHLRAADVTALFERGFDFGTHGVTHRPLSHLGPEALRQELLDSKNWLEDTISAPVNVMSLPVGQGGERVRAAAFQQGYRLIANARELGNQQLIVPGELNRFPVLHRHGPDHVLQMASASPSYMLRRRMRAAATWLPRKVLRS